MDTSVAPRRAGPDRPLTLDVLNRIPLHFEANDGQTDAAVRFLARGRGYRIFLTSTEAVLALAPTPAAGSSSPAVVRMGLLGANSAPEIVAEAPLPGKVNYFVGRDLARWRTNIPTFARVRYRGVYPGIDLVFYGNQGTLEYDFIIAPGADPTVIALKIDGANSLGIDDQGDLLLQMAGGVLRHRRPVVYQDVNGIRLDVGAGYSIDKAGRVSFKVASYDRGRTLIIDPALAFSTFIGGSQNDTGAGIAVDAARNVYVVGGASSPDFPTTAGAYDTTASPSDAFVTKFNPAGSALVYSTFLGGSGGDAGAGIALDASGNAYLTGTTASTDFPTTPGALDTTCGTDSTCNGGFINQDGFVAKLNASGSALLYSTYLGGSGDDQPFGIAADAGGNAYVGGATSSPDFPTTAGAFDTSANGAFDAFVAKVNATASALVYSTYVGGSAIDLARGIAVDGSGSAYVTGRAVSANFPTTVGAFDTIANGLDEAFVTKVNAAGSGLTYSTYLGGSGHDRGFAIAVDGSGNAYVAGYTESGNFPTTAGVFDTTLNGSSDLFVTKVNPSGAALVYSTYLGGTSTEGTRQYMGIALDAAANAHVVGDTNSADFPTVAAPQPVSGGGRDVVVAKLNAAGSALLYSTYLGGSSTDSGLGITVDSGRNAYVTGDSLSGDFPVTPGAFSTSCGSCPGLFVDVFVTRISPSDSVGLYNSAAGVFYLRNTNAAGPADVVFGYGPPGLGWISFTGDFDGNGTDTVGLYDPATSVFYLRNSNTAGPADIVFAYGPPGGGWIPFAGDWDGNGTDTVGLFNLATSTFYLRNANSAGPADLAFNYGPPGLMWIPMAGDWDGNGTDTVGLLNMAAGVFYLRNSNSAGPADIVFGYGPAGLGWIRVTGDWNGDGIDSVGLYDPTGSVFYLRNTNAAGPADIAFGYGPPGGGWIPRAGNWDGQ
jgi:hypothetical protein